MLPDIQGRDSPSLSPGASMTISKRFPWGKKNWRVPTLALVAETKQNCPMPNPNPHAIAFTIIRIDRYRRAISASASASARLGAIAAAATLMMIGLTFSAADWPSMQSHEVLRVALYPHDGRKRIEGSDEAKYRGAGVLMCFTDIGTLERAAAAWLVGSRGLVVLNAHNFVDRSLRPTHPVEDCFFRIKGVDRYFESNSLILGVDANSKSLHITDDWALLRLIEPVSQDIEPQPTPDASFIPTGTKMRVVMVSPAGHSNSRLESTFEECEIQTIDEPSEARIRRARHDCNDGYGGSGSGLFTEDGRLIAMHSASLDMNARRPFDIESHYGSALLFEGGLVDAIKREAAERLR
jgi:hypothetical protein